MIGNTAEAEDLTQEVFLQMFRKIGTFRGEAAFSTWVHRLTVNMVLMRLRKKKLVTASLEDISGRDTENVSSYDPGAVDPVMAGAVDRLNLGKAMQALPAGYRLIFQLHDVEGYEHQEISSMIGCSVGNSKSQLHKARMKLRDLLQGKPYPTPKSPR